jgi:biopolymer transport protein ExbB
LILGFIAGEVSRPKSYLPDRGGQCALHRRHRHGDGPDPTGILRPILVRPSRRAQTLSAVREEDGSVPEGQIELVRSAVARTQIDEAAALNKGWSCSP